jgi:hypothetical protein
VGLGTQCRVAAMAERQARTHCASGTVQTGFEIISEFKWFETFSNYFKFDRLEKYISMP